MVFQSGTGRFQGVSEKAEAQLRKRAADEHEENQAGQTAASTFDTMVIHFILPRRARRFNLLTRNALPGSKIPPTTVEN